MSSKKKVTITIDPIIWEVAKEKLPCGRSEFIEDQLRKGIGFADDKETKLRKEIGKRQEEINVLESQLCKIREEKLKKTETRKDLTQITSTLERIKEKSGVIGKNQIRNLSKHQDIEYGVLVDLCNNIDLKIVENFEPPREGGMKSGRGL